MGVCVVENLSRGFLFEWPPLLLWVIRVYVVWVKGKKVTLKNLQTECFATTSQEGLTHETLVKLTVWHNSSASSYVLLTCPFGENPSRKLLVS